MAKSTPSLLALLGLVAVAGYQNRGKISDMLASAREGGGAPGRDTPDAGILGEFSRMFGGSDAAAETSGRGGLTEGLHDLIDRFRGAGQTAAADSWVSAGANRDLDPADLERAIGGDTVDELAQKTGLARADILSRLAQALPETVNRMTPDGRLPSEDEAQRLI